MVDWGQLMQLALGVSMLAAAALTLRCGVTERPRPIAPRSAGPRVPVAPEARPLLQRAASLELHATLLSAEARVDH